MLALRMHLVMFRLRRFGGTNDRCGYRLGSGKDVCFCLVVRVWCFCPCALRCIMARSLLWLLWQPRMPEGPGSRLALSARGLSDCFRFAGLTSEGRMPAATMTVCWLEWCHRDILRRQYRFLFVHVERVFRNMNELFRWNAGCSLSLVVDSWIGC